MNNTTPSSRPNRPVRGSPLPDPPDMRPVLRFDRPVSAETARYIVENYPPRRRPVCPENERGTNVNYLPQRNDMQAPSRRPAPPQTVGRPPRPERPAPVAQPQRPAAANLPPRRPAPPQTVGRPPRPERPASVTQPRRPAAANPPPRRPAPPQTVNRPERPAPATQPRETPVQVSVRRSECPTAESAVKGKHGKPPFSVKRAAAGAAAVAALVVMTAFTLNRNPSGISAKKLLNGGVTGHADAAYRYIDDAQIVTQELVGQELKYEYPGYGNFKIQFKSVTAYDNLYSLCGGELKDNLDNEQQFGLSHYEIGLQYPDDGTTVYEGYSKRWENSDGQVMYNYDYPDFFDTETGQLKLGCHIFVFEVAVTNIDAVADTVDWDTENANQFRLSQMFAIYNRSDSSRTPDSDEPPEKGQCCYMAEGLDSENRMFMAEIPQGETKTIHLGFFMKGDNSAKPYSRIGLVCFGVMDDYDEAKMQLWFDLSEAVKNIQH